MRAVLPLALLLWAGPIGLANTATGTEPLPELGPAPPFALTAQNGTPVSLADLRGKVVAVDFIYTACPDICPLLTQKMLDVQHSLGEDFGGRIVFVSIT